MLGAAADDLDPARRIQVAEGIVVDLNGPHIELPGGATAGVDGDYDMGVLPRGAVESLPLARLDEALAIFAEDEEGRDLWVIDVDPPDRAHDVEPMEGVLLHTGGVGELCALVNFGLPRDVDETFADSTPALLAPMLSRLGAKAMAPFEGPRDEGQVVVKVEFEQMANRVVGDLLELATDVRALLVAARRGDIDRAVARDLLAAGHIRLLIGKPESAWLEVKKQPWDLSTDTGKAEAAKDLSALANARGGLLVIPAKTEGVSGRDVIASVKIFPLERFSETQLRDVLSAWTFPPLQVEVDVVEVSAGRGFVVLNVDAAPDDKWPHLVVKDPEAPFPSAAIAAYRRDGDQNRALGAAELHALLTSKHRSRNAVDEGQSAIRQQQRAIDRTLHALPRDVIRELDRTEILGGWRADLALVVARFTDMCNELENHIDDDELESLRLSLHDAAVVFRNAEAENGFSHDIVDGVRNVGRTGGQLEGDPPGTAERFHDRARIISAARDKLVRAHNEFVSGLLERFFSVEALGDVEYGSRRDT